MATDFFHVATGLLQRLYVLFFIGLGLQKGLEHRRDRSSERGVGHPTGEERHRRPHDAEIAIKVLGRDRDTKYVASLDEVFKTTGTEILMTPFRTPNANAIAERFVRTVRSECLDHLLIVNEAQLERVLRSCACHYNGHRPHRVSLKRSRRGKVSSAARVPALGARHRHLRGHSGLIRRYDRLGGSIHEYERAA